MLYLASDHRGFKLKEKIKKYLNKNKIIFTDLGALKYDKDDDYPDFAKILALKILENKNNLGIALCGSGAGMSIALNRFKNIRAGLAFNPKMAEAQKQQDNINVLVIASDFTKESTAFLMVDKFLKTKFLKKQRYLRRIKKLS
ncbi:MAG TPA: RpiB/LacA/LacB family sugar-phosphate isomerase [Candidatus Paceibacterota bacterium]|jgi:ribose 5-phosphate isomerase B|nr:RpiB/LacA/LacB family sugar-phosphate isomerase [Candidatus Paceibacterota bacterium]